MLRRITGVRNRRGSVDCVEEICIRPMEAGQAGAVSALIGRVLMEVNIRDYSREDMVEFAAYYSPEKVASIPASGGHSYVAMRGEELLACGSVVPVEGNPDECMIQALFVRPDWEGRGVGRRLMQTLEADPLFRAARRALVSASLTAHEFYGKLGYRYRDGKKICEDNDHYWMEKFH